jgi:hypothetical protein
MQYELKSEPKAFAAIISGEKQHEICRHDQPYGPGDILLLREFDPETGKYTGREQQVWVMYITSADNPCALSDRGLQPGFCIMSLSPVKAIKYLASCDD